jgi:hypothetical protein
MFAEDKTSRAKYIQFNCITGKKFSSYLINDPYNTLCQYDFRPYTLFNYNASDTDKIPAEVCPLCGFS